MGMDFSAGAGIRSRRGRRGHNDRSLVHGHRYDASAHDHESFYILGTMMPVSVNKSMAYMMGAMMHAVMGLAFGLAHAGVFRGFEIESNEAAWGLLFGLVHWMIVGMAPGMMGKMHPLMKSGQLAAPGAFATDSPPMTMMGFLMLHLLFGAVVGALYSAWA